MFVTFEGIEGAGKSTQARLLAERLRAAGYHVALTREPGGTPLANAVRALLLHPEASLSALQSAHLVAGGEQSASAESMLPVTELLLLSAARAQHVARIREELAADKIVISDRFADATWAYQGAGRGLDQQIITTLEQIATGGLRPDLTLLFDLPVSEGLRRKHAQGQEQAEEWNRMDAEEQAFHECVRASYLQLAAAEPGRWVILDATQRAEQLAEQVWQDVHRRLSTTSSADVP
ncbi:MAG TPA: dTMP kinase [Ktedonobacterales bacterium]